LIFDSTASKSGIIALMTQKTIKVARIAALSGGTKGDNSQAALTPMAACVCHIMAAILGSTGSSWLLESADLTGK
jgi:hypothetical protein